MIPGISVCVSCGGYFQRRTTTISSWLYLRSSVFIGGSFFLFHHAIESFYARASIAVTGPMPPASGYLLNSFLEHDMEQRRL
jgi:hypothetical protein